MMRRLASLGISLGYAAWANLTRQEQDRCVVLYYHGVTNGQADRFAQQMSWLKSNYSVLALRELLERNWTGRSVCITFDDGLDNVRQNALPIIQDLNVPATLFVVPGNLGRKLSWAIDNRHPDRQEILSTMQQLKGYPADLVEIGSHTMTHPRLPSLTGSALAGELMESKKSLEEGLGREVVSLSVPFGLYNQQTLDAAREAGYKMVVTCDPSVLRREDSMFPIGRFKVTPDDWELEYRLKAGGNHRWRRAWQSLRGRTQAGNEKREYSRISPSKAGRAD